MRHPLVPALAVVLLLCLYAVAGTALAVGTALADGTALAGGPGPGDDVTVDGTVTAVDGAPAGDAVVLVGEYGLLSKHSPDELRDIAADDPQDLAVVEVDGDGGFSTTVPWKRADAALALGDDGVSELVRLGHANQTLDLQLHERRPQRVYTAGASFAHDENRTRLYVSLVNNGDHAVENLTVDVEKLPAGWSVAGVDTDGSNDADAGTITWSSVPPGAEVDTTLTLAAPRDVAVGEYEVAFAATSDSHPVEAEDATVVKMPEDTAGPTTTVLGGDDETTSTPRITDDLSATTGMTDGTTPTETPVDSPGLGLVVTISGLVAGALLWARRS